MEAVYGLCGVDRGVPEVWGSAYDMRELLNEMCIRDSGAQVQKLLKAAAALDIQTICPLHGPVLKENLGHYLEKYNIWSSYEAESEGVVIAYTSVYGNTKKAVELLASRLREKNCPEVVVCDSVSYTHLDVYKRQHLYSGGSYSGYHPVRYR